MKLINAKKVIEIGVFTGYTTLALALGLPEDGKVIALDISEEFPAIGKPFWVKAGVANKIDLQIGPALEALEKLQQTQAGTFDFAFIDADKSNYSNYLSKLLPLMKKGGVLAFDNVLWSGRTADPRVQDKDTIALRALNSQLKSDMRFEIAMIPLADGVTFARVL